MQTASEFLGLTPPAPLSATLVARPVRACVFVPLWEGVPWQRLVEHALATQTRVWGGTSNLVVPLAPELADDELFWRLVDRFDPDVVAVHLPTYADVEEIAPECHAERVERLEQRMRANNFGDEVIAQELARLHKERFWLAELPGELASRFIDRIAPLQHPDRPRLVHLDGSSPPPHPLTDVAAVRDLPRSVADDITATLDDTTRLSLTHAVGRLLPAFKNALAARGVMLQGRMTEDRAAAVAHIWPRHSAVVAGAVHPRRLVDDGLARRTRYLDREEVVVVVGDEPRDFLLYHGLSRLRPYVHWLPAAWLHDMASIRRLAEATRWVLRTEIGHGEVAVTAASSNEAAATAMQALSGADVYEALETRLADWRELMPTSYMWVVDHRSERRVSLLRHEGETQELPTPTPVSIATDDPTEARWMVDVEVAGWCAVRNPSLAEQVFRGPVVDSNGVRTSSLGASYFGLGPVVQTFLGLEGSTARLRLRPRTVAEQVSDILQPVGWEVALSDKGAYAAQSARLFDGVEGLAAALRSRPTRSVLDAYLTPTETNDPGRFLKDTRRRYLSLRDVQCLVGDRDLGAGLVTELYDRGVLIRGHALKCEHCRATSFYSLTAEQRFTCTRCRIDQKATRFSWLMTPEPEFRYALAEVVYLFLLNNGDLPLLAAHEHFVVGRSRERAPFDVAFELELTPPGGSRREHDIVASWGAELWLGEATKDDRLEDGNGDEIERLARLAESTRAVGTRGVLFVTTRESFCDRTKQNVANVFAEPLWPEVVYVEGFDVGAAVEPAV